jgi:hypothetical protein
MESYDLQCSLHSLFATAFWAHMDFMVQGNGCWQITRVRPRADCMSNHAIERSSFEWRHWTWNLEATRSYWQHGGRFLCRVRVGVVWTIVKSRKRIIQSLLDLGVMVTAIVEKALVSRLPNRPHWSCGSSRCRKSEKRHALSLD